MSAPRGWVRTEFETAPIDATRADTNISAESERWKDEEEIEEPAWRSNLDATKGIGYPAREDGRYGSYPSHHGFDDESEP